jgi:hypothetical protein
MKLLLMMRWLRLCIGIENLCEVKNGAAVAFHFMRSTTPVNWFFCQGSVGGAFRNFHVSYALAWGAIGFSLSYENEVEDDGIELRC